MNCGSAGTCIKGNCICEAGYSNVDNICLDMCENIDCVDGTCADGLCICNTGFVNIDNVCEQTCELQPCKVSGN